MALFGLLSVVLFLVTYATTRERVAPQKEAAVDIRTDLGLLLKNRPWLVMVGAAICTMSAVAVRGAVTVHYFKYFVRNSDEAVFSLGDAGSPWFLSFDATTLFLSSGTCLHRRGGADRLRPPHPRQAQRAHRTDAPQRRDGGGLLLHPAGRHGADVHREHPREHPRRADPGPGVGAVHRRRGLRRVEVRPTGHGPRCSRPPCLPRRWA